MLIKWIDFIRRSSLYEIGICKKKREISRADSIDEIQKWNRLRYKEPIIFNKILSCAISKVNLFKPFWKELHYWHLLKPIGIYPCSKWVNFIDWNDQKNQEY